MCTDVHEIISCKFTEIETSPKIEYVDDQHVLLSLTNMKKILFIVCCHVALCLFWTRCSFWENVQIAMHYHFLTVQLNKWTWNIDLIWNYFIMWEERDWSATMFILFDCMMLWLTNQKQVFLKAVYYIWLNFWDEIEEKNKRLFNGMLDKDQFKDVFWSVVLRCVLCEGHPGFHWRVLTERCHKKSCVLCKQAEHNMMCKINKPSTYMRWVKFELFPPVDWCYPWVLQT